MSNLDQARVASRSTETTRAALIKAATSVFAEYGYDGGSVRLITQRAMANQAAVNYHFGGKDGLYREVLIAATRAFEENAFSGPRRTRRAFARRRAPALSASISAAARQARSRQPLSAHLRLGKRAAERSRSAPSSWHSPPRIFRLAERVVTAVPAARRLRGDRHIRDAVARAATDVLRARRGAAGAAALLAQIRRRSSLERLVDTLASLSLRGLAE